MLTMIMMAIWTAMSVTMKFKMPLSIMNLSMMFVVTTLQMKKGLANNSSSTMMTYASNMNTSLILLSIWVMAMMILVSTKYQNTNSSPQLFNMTVSVLLITITAFFMTDNLIILYFMFEMSLIPTLILIMKWGYQPERLKSSFYFMMYTICASLPLLLIILKMKNSMFSSSINSLMPFSSFQINSTSNLTFTALTMAFMVKIPMWGTHLWLPKAHVEAPVSGSMILAGILLKLGGYGLIKMMEMTFKITSKVKFMLFSINVWGSLVVGMVCLSAVDVKSLIAYSSIIHMNMMVLGVLSNSPIGLYGSLLMMIAHGISSPGLFALANLNYEMTQTRNLMMQKGLFKTQTKLALFWFILLAANMAAPPSLNLASEILIYTSVLKMSFSFCLLIATMTFMSAAYNLYLYSSQQGNQSKTSLPTMNMTSKDMLMGTAHCVPVFILCLAMNTLM